MKSPCSFDRPCSKPLRPTDRRFREIKTDKTRPVERKALALWNVNLLMNHLKQVSKRLFNFVPIGRGQRELALSRTVRLVYITVVDTILNQKVWVLRSVSMSPLVEKESTVRTSGRNIAQIWCHGLANDRCSASPSSPGHYLVSSMPGLQWVKNSSDAQTRMFYSKDDLQTSFDATVKSLDLGTSTWS